jgi:hypothetical protein
MNSNKQNPSKPDDATTSKPREGLVSIDDTIDEIGRKALDSARRSEETAKRKRQSGEQEGSQKRAIRHAIPYLDVEGMVVPLQHFGLATWPDEGLRTTTLDLGRFVGMITRGRHLAWSAST